MKKLGPHVLLVVALSVLLASLLPGTRAAADDATPTALPSLPDPTVIPVTPEALPTGLPTVVRERPNPVPTSPPPPTEAPAPQATENGPPSLRFRPAPTAAPAAPIITPRPVPPAASQPPVEAPLPSPAELEQSARLRWGRHIPWSVRRWAFLIVSAARKYHLSANLIAAVMTMESNGDPLAWSSADARGLMQVLHGPWDPRESVFTGARMLAELYAEFGDWTLALAAYNAGPDAVRAYHGVPPYRETRDYVIIVQYLWDLFSQHRLTLKRKQQFRSSLRDLQRFADQRKKVPRLARIAHVPTADIVHLERGYLCHRFGEQCNTTQPQRLFPTLDPFWPLGDVPDPLQRVDPFATS